ncbi:MAG: hypothetical protein M3P93_00805 [Actinomycetota bacterium]|nr:hypothetical protein [Actinomycetota bacterium]
MPLPEILNYEARAVLCPDKISPRSGWSATGSCTPSPGSPTYFDLKKYLGR